MITLVWRQISFSMSNDLNQEYKNIQEEEIRTNLEISNLDKRIKRINVIAWVLIILGVIIGLGGIMNLFIQSKELKLNEVGDFIGGTVASLWSLSGLFFIYIAFLGQQKQMLFQNLELQFNRFEVKSTRFELKEQKLQMIEQNKSIKLQRFENTFFNMINLLHEIVNSIDIIEEKENIVTRLGGSMVEQFNNAEKHTHFLTKKGKDCFVSFRKELLENYESLSLKDEEEIKKIKIAFRDFYYKNEPDLRHYIQNVFQIALFIEKSEIENKNDYVELFRSQFSTNELVIIYYYSLSDFKYHWFNSFLENYTFLKLFNSGKLLKSEHRDFHESMFFDKGK